jgi:hypothetical protein
MAATIRTVDVLELDLTLGLGFINVQISLHASLPVGHCRLQALFGLRFKKDEIVSEQANLTIKTLS